MERLMRARRAFLAGMNTLLAPRQTSQRKIHDILSKSDAESLQQDWHAVGRDIQRSMETYGKR